MKKILVAGLGNPGRKYKETRHNIGFWVVDRLAEQASLAFKEEGVPTKYQLADAHIWGQKVFLLKPMEYMNRSGGPVKQVASYYGIAHEDILVVHDDLDISLGRLKFVRSGGHGGHNGIRSIIEGLGTRNFPRLKIGIGRPPQNVPADRYVLSRFSPQERNVVEEVVELSVKGIEEFIRNGIDSAMNKFNGIEVAPS